MAVSYGTISAYRISARLSRGISPQTLSRRNGWQTVRASTSDFIHRKPTDHIWEIAHVR